MKKALALLLVLAMVVFAFGCAAPASEPAAATEPAKTEKAEEKPAETAAATEAPAAEEAQTFTVALLLPYSGPYANIGASIDAAVKYCYEYFLNEVGGFQSKNVEVKFLDLDFGDDVDQATSLYEKNVAELDACIGCYKTAATIAVATLASKYEKVFINCSSTSDSTCSIDTNYVYKCILGNSAAYEQIECLRWLESKDDHKYSSWATIYGSDDYTVGMHGIVDAICTELGWTCVVSESIQTGQTTDASTAINKVKNSGADIFVPTLTAVEAVLIQKQCREYKMDIPIYSSGGGYCDPNFFINVDGAADNVVNVSTWIYDVIAISDPAKKACEYAQKCTDACGVDFSDAGSTAWLSMGLLLQAIENAPSLDHNDIANAMNEMNVPEGHFSCLMTQYPGETFEDIMGSDAMCYNMISKGAYVYAQAINDYWTMIFSPATGEVPNCPLTWPTVGYGPAH